MNARPILCCLALATTTRAEIVRQAPPLPPLKEGAWDTMKLTWNRAEKEDGHWGNAIGNNHFAAKIKGGVESETLALNDKHFWSDWPRDTEDPKRKAALEETRRKLAADDIPGANQAARGMWGPHEVGSYMPVGKLHVDFDGHTTAAAKGYRRELDMDRAVSTVRYELDGTAFTREAFASYPDEIIAMKLTADGKAKLDLTVRFSHPPEMAGHATVAAEGTGLVMKGKAPAADRKTFDAEKGMTFEARVVARAEGGKVVAKDGALRVEGAASVTLYYASATSYNGYLKEPGTEGVDPSPVVKERIRKALAKPWGKLLETHVADHRALFRRFWAGLGGDKPDKHVLGLQYARYDMIAVSRDGDRPHNQQGMWSHEWTAMSNCSHYLNENVQKYYGIIETTNLADTGEPLWNWMDQLAGRGAITAKTDFGFRGWMAPHYSDIWASTPLKGGNNEWAIWPVGGIWLCQNLWDHHAFSGDKEFLAKRAYPLMKGAAEFALDYLVEDENGLLVSSPSTSPENQFRLVEGGPTYAVTRAATMDTALIRELFENVVAASKLLDADAALRTEIEAALTKLAPYPVGANGELQEWFRDFPKRDNGHRHASHVVAAWPLRQISPRKTPDLAKAAIHALNQRGGGGYHPDKAAMYARLGEGDKAEPKLGGNGHTMGGQWSVLYAGMPEMFLHSHLIDTKGGHELDLLPALPTSWKNGKVSGIRGRGGYELEIEWKDGELKKTRIDSKLGTVPDIFYQGQPLDPAKDPRVTLNLLR